MPLAVTTLTWARIISARSAGEIGWGMKFRIDRVDPAVFSNPFITTFVDATGLIIYFLVARAVLGV